ncbi:FAD:protein FMN transferase [Maribacter flavus]|uniref:FAD:protein FMN transferase n=1 Tax=Maribacter flavus TaxID=1658664 RepID=UPI001FE7A098|nr:FAD:protein FMN transferase [Maribacter flavus]
MRFQVIILSFFVFCSLYGQEKKLITVKQTVTLMGGPFEITVVSTNEDLGYINIQEAIGEIARIEKLISSWDENSETHAINKNAGIKPVKVSLELFKLIERCKQISDITDGAFDISFAALDNLWDFQGPMSAKPTHIEISKGLSRVNYRDISLDENNLTVFLTKPGMKISFGAIGKGYAVDRAKDLLVSKKVIAGMINASGDLTTWGTKASGEKWMLGVANPNNRTKVFSWLPIVESSVATSGNKERYVLINNEKYKDILDPRTGYPISDQIQSVSIFSKNAELCDALATAIMVMGTNAGLALVNQLGDTEVIIVDSENKMHKSTGLILNQIP